MSDPILLPAGTYVRRPGTGNYGTVEISRHGKDGRPFYWVRWANNGKPYTSRVRAQDIEQVAP